MLWMCCTRRSAGKTKSTDLKSDSKSTSSFNSINHNETVELEDTDHLSDEEIKAGVIIDHNSYNDPPLRRPSTFTVETGTQTFDESSSKTFAKDEILSRREKAKSDFIKCTNCTKEAEGFCIICVGKKFCSCCFEEIHSNLPKVHVFVGYKQLRKRYTQP